MNKDSVVLFFVGLGAGVGVSLLFAPKSGPGTRGMIASGAQQSADYLARQAAAARDSAADAIELGRQELLRRRRTIEDAIETGKRAYYDAVAQPAG